MIYLLKDIRKMTDDAIRGYIEKMKVKIVQHNTMHGEASNRAMKNLTKFEQVLRERGVNGTK
jgi:hypothetical protein